MIDFGPPPLVFPKPAIIRPATADLLKYGLPALGVLPFSPMAAGTAAGTAAPGPTTLTFVGDHEGSGSTINIDAIEFEPGDLCIITNASRGGSAVTPSGFTPLRNSGDVDALESVISAKILVGDETSVNGIAPGSWAIWGVLIVRPDAPITSFVDHDTGNAENTGGTPASQTLNCADEAPPILAYCSMACRGTNLIEQPDAEMIEFASPLDSFGQDAHYAYYRIFNAEDTPFDLVNDMGDGGSANALLSGWLSFT